jgi:hypothetical protein
VSAMVGSVNSTEWLVASSFTDDESVGVAPSLSEPLKVVSATAVSLLL